MSYLEAVQEFFRNMGRPSQPSPKPAPLSLAPRVRRPDARQQQFLRDQLGRRGLPTKQVEKLQFVEGLDDKAGFWTRTFFPHAEAVTQGNTIYVQPSYFDPVANFQSATPFEEAYHAAKFADEGEDRFAPHYAIGMAGGTISQGAPYQGNVEEAFAKGASRQMFDEYREQLRARLRSAKSPKLTR